MEQVIISTSKTENGFSASCELLPGWIVAFTGSFSEFVIYVHESIDFYVDCAKTDQEPYPSVFDSDYELLFKMDIQSLLYCYDKILTRAALSRMTGINQRQLGHYICGRSKPRKPQSDKIVGALHSLGKELQSITT
ncbi:MAG: helix-turn-helix transcriptional regulator [Bacteroidales bacterium]|nr:helix-turn-helix transcriptional regulator [Bacteroidales bacterium]MBR6438911.1 helix-turn-helix transcriptional regulator [Bacteroidales bacterium]